MNYYFAYGSNLHHLQMKRRCPNCRFLKKIVLPDIQIQRIKERIKGPMNLSLKWYDAFNNVSDSQINYMRLLLLNNEDPTKDARIKVSTIHGAKGRERENIVLWYGLWNRNTIRNVISKSIGRSRLDT